MTTRNSVEDIESGTIPQHEPEYNDSNEGAELERIKGNYRTTVVVPELPANYSETQVAFQELQIELQEFLGHYIPKVASLQAIFASNLSYGVGLDDRIARRMTKASMLIQNPDSGANGERKDSYSQSNLDLNLPSRNSSINHRKTGTTPANKHMQNLQTFLITHMENLSALQAAVSSGSEMPAKRSISSCTGPTSVTEVSGADKRHDVNYGLYQRCQSVVVISTAMSIFIFALLTLSHSILGPDRYRVAYDVAMMLAFLSLSFHFGIMLLGGHGVRRVAQHSLGEKSKEDFGIYINFYLTICAQMQFLASLFMIIATAILAFLIFSSVGFPSVVVVFSTILGAIVFASVYFKVLITFPNVVFLAKNIPRLGWRSLDYVMTNVKARPAVAHSTKF